MLSIGTLPAAPLSVNIRADYCDAKPEIMSIALSKKQPVIPGGENIKAINGVGVSQVSGSKKNLSHKEM